MTAVERAMADVDAVAERIFAHHAKGQGFSSDLYEHDEQTQVYWRGYALAAIEAETCPNGDLRCSCAVNKGHRARATYKPAEREGNAEPDTVYLSTLQFAWGGLLDSQPADNQTHLVRGTKRGTPGPTLCGIDRFAKDGPGWSVGGGISGPGITHTPCEGCVAAARESFPGLPISGLAAEGIAAQVGAQHHRYPSSEQSMTRDEAIEHIWELSMQVAGEFCCSNEERDELEQQTREALSALGVDC